MVGVSNDLIQLRGLFDVHDEVDMNSFHTALALVNNGVCLYVKKNTIQFRYSFF